MPPPNKYPAFCSSFVYSASHVSHIFFRNCYGVDNASTTGRALTTMMRPFRQGCARSFTVFRPYYASRCGAEYSRDQDLTTACVQSDSGGEISGDQTRVRGFQSTNNWYDGNVHNGWGPDHRIGIRRDRVRNPRGRSRLAGEG